MLRNPEQLLPTQLKNQLSSRKTQIDKVIETLQMQIADAPAGNLRITKNKGTAQFLHVISSENKSGIYIPKKSKLILELAQKDYNKKIIHWMTAITQ